MNKRMREILAEIQSKTDEAKSFMNGEDKDLEKASAIMDEVDELKKEFETEKRIYEAEKADGLVEAEAHVSEDEESTSKTTVTGTQIIAKQVRAIMKPGTYASDKALMETVNEDGGYTVPEDIQTQINHWPEIVDSFLDEISVEPVTTNKGARTYQSKADTEAFAEIDENGKITKEISAPKFERITYNIKDKAGFMPVSNDLINDSDSNIEAVVVEWLGRANIATANAKILAILNAKNKTDFGGIDGIKKAVNVTLGQAYKASSVIITNDDGLNYLDTLKDENGRYLLNPDPTDRLKQTLRCGVNVLPIKVKANNVFASDGTKIPFIVGDLSQGIKKYDRRSISIDASGVASIGDFNAFAQNMTLFRGILRDDYVELDKASYVVGYIDVAVSETASGTGEGSDEEPQG